MKSTIRSTFSVLLILVMIFSVGFPTIAASATPVLIQGNDQDIPSATIANTNQYKWEPPVQGVTTILLNDLIKSSNGGYVVNNTDWIKFTIVGTTVSWESNLEIAHVFVKGGPVGNLYSYPSGQKSDTGLTTPMGPNDSPYGISHISIYIGSQSTQQNGSLEIKKIIDAAPGATLPAGPFNFNITVIGTSEGASYPEGLSKSFTSNGMSQTWDNLLPGIYSISEASPGANWSVNYSSSTVTIAAGESKTATVTNTYTLVPPTVGSLQITKNIQAAPGATLPAGPFSFDITVTGISEGASHQGGLLKSFTSDGMSQTWDNLLPGTYSISEASPGANWSVNYSSSTVTVAAGDSKTATVTNTYTFVPTTIITTTVSSAPLTGAINVTKFLDSNGNGSNDDGNLGTTGIVIELYDANKVFMRSVTTSGSPELSFSNLTFGTYFVREVLTGDYSVTTGNLDADGFSQPIVINSTTPQTLAIGNARIVVEQLEEPVLEEVVEEAPPLATPVVPITETELPDTGEIPPYFAYGFGSLMILAGLFLKRKY
jgi:LPXTG-motif cell wall-anchored protein